MHCPFCQAADTKVIDSRLIGDCMQVRRRRECVVCQERFTTYEAAELIMPQVVKNDGRRESFSQEKLRTGMQRALEKRPVGAEKIEIAVNNIKRLLRASGEREIQSSILGEWVMAELRKLDHIAYVRFASVYRSFKDVNAFFDEIKRLEDGEREV